LFALAVVAGSVCRTNLGCRTPDQGIVEATSGFGSAVVAVLNRTTYCCLLDATDSGAAFAESLGAPFWLVSDAAGIRGVRNAIDVSVAVATWFVANVSTAAPNHAAHRRITHAARRSTDAAIAQQARERSWSSTEMYTNASSIYPSRAKSGWFPPLLVALTLAIPPNAGDATSPPIAATRPIELSESDICDFVDCMELVDGANFAGADNRSVGRRTILNELSAASNNALQAVISRYTGRTSDEFGPASR
jgi:hypothetical protein